MFYRPRTVEWAAGIGHPAHPQPQESTTHLASPQGRSGQSRASTIGRQSFITYTEHSAPSLDRQPNALEVEAEVELSGLLTQLLGRLNSSNEIAAAITAVETGPKLEVNPYRPPRGAHLRQAFEDMQVSEWGRIKGAGLAVKGRSMAVHDGRQRQPSAVNSATTTPPPLSPPALHPTAQPFVDGVLGNVTGSDAMKPLSFAVAKPDPVLTVRGEGVRQPAVGRYARVGAFGGVEEETICADGDPTEEALDVDVRQTADPTSNARSLSTADPMGSDSNVAAADDAVDAREAIQAQKRVAMGFPPVSPRGCVADEVKHLIFAKVWEEVITPQLLRLVGAPEKPPPVAPVKPPTQERGRPPAENSGSGAGRVGTAGAARSKSSDAIEGAQNRRGRTAGTVRGDGAHGPKKRSSSARRFVSMYIEEQHTLAQEGEERERVPTPPISSSPFSSSVNATQPSTGVPVPTGLGEAGTSAVPAVPIEQANGQATPVLMSGREHSGDDNRSATSSVRQSRPYARAHTAHPSGSSQRQLKGRDQ